VYFQSIETINQAGPVRGFPSMIAAGIIAERSAEDFI
jgi:hypothetical protein